MNVCESRVENSVNQKIFEDYLFGDKYKLSDIEIELNRRNEIYAINIRNVGITDEPISLRGGSEVSEASRSFDEVVRSYSDFFEQVNIAVKFSKKNNEEEISNQLRNSGCDVLKLRYLGKKVEAKDNKIYPYLYFMELIDGNLYSWNVKMHKNYPYGIPRKIIFNVLEKLWKQMNCLLKNGKVYTNIDLENILFKCDDPLKIGKDGVRFILGNLGSLVLNENGESYSSFPPFEYKDKYGYIPVGKSLDSDKAILAWQFGILTLLLTTYMEGKSQNKNINDYFPSLNYLNFRNFNGDVKIRDFNDRIKSYNNRTVVDISKLLNLDPSNREWKAPVYKEAEETEEEAEKPLNQNNEILPPFPVESEQDQNQDVNCAYKKLSLNDIYSHLSDCSVKNYRKMSMKVHPDKNVGCKNTELINDRFKLLGKYEDICKQRNRVPFVFNQASSNQASSNQTSNQASSNQTSNQASSNQDSNQSSNQSSNQIVMWQPPKQATPIQPPRQATPIQPPSTNENRSSSIIYGEWKVIVRKPNAVPVAPKVIVRKPNTVPVAPKVVVRKPNAVPVAPKVVVRKPKAVPKVVVRKPKAVPKVVVRKSKAVPKVVVRKSKAVPKVVVRKPKAVPKVRKSSKK